MIIQKASSLLLAGLILVFSTACKRQQITKISVEQKDQTEVVIKKDSMISSALPKVEEKVAETPKKLLVQIDNVDFNYLKLKSKVNYHEGQNDMTVTANFHIKKDSAIWFSMNVSMIEGARGVITQDSIHFFALDSKTFKRNYYDLSLDSLSNQFNFDMNFKLLQALLIGNMPIAQNDEDSVSVAENAQVIHQIVSPYLLQNVISTDNHKLKKLIALPDSGSGQMIVSYDNFLPIESFLFPQDNSIEIQADKDGKPIQTKITLQHTKIEFVNENPGFNFRRK